MTKRKKAAFSEWAAQWLELSKPMVKGNTFAAGYKNPVEKHLIPNFGDAKLKEIRQADIQGYINLIAEKYSLDTVKKHKSCLVQIFDMAIENDLCSKNPAKRIKIPKTKERKEKSVYNEKQATLVFNFAYMHRFGAEIQFMLETGVSRGELLALTWEDIDLINQDVNIRHGVAIVPDSKTGRQQTVLGEPKNSYRKRKIPISSEMTRILDNHPQLSAFVFCNINGEINNPRTWSRRHFDVFMSDMQDFYKEKGVSIPTATPHQLRHTRASLFINGGKNPIATAKYLGHADLEMLLKRYAHSSTDELKEQLDIK